MNDKKFYIRVAIVAVVGLAFYYIASPYQNCLRAAENDESVKFWCTKHTSW